MTREQLEANPMPDILLPVDTLRQIRDNFTLEITRAANGGSSSLAFIRNPLPQQNLVREGERFRVLVIGGSVYEEALVEDGNIGPSARMEQPLFRTRNDLLSFVEDRLDFQTHVVAINFACPLLPILRLGRLDGSLLRGTKEHRFRGLVGSPVGSEIEEYLRRKRGWNVKTTVANDTVCLILAGLGQDERERLGGGIVGTGLNMGFFLDANTVVNLESGSFSKFEQTPTGKEIDAASEEPGSQRLEKEISGKYLYAHYNRAMEAAGLDHRSLSSTEELSNVAEGEDKSVQTIVARQLMERSASLVACQVAGIYRHKNEPSMTFIMEGTLFWKGWHYKEMVERCLEQLDVPKGTVRFVQIENSAIKGAAALVSR